MQPRPRRPVAWRQVPRRPLPPALAVLVGRANWWPSRNLKPLHGRSDADRLDHPRPAEAGDGADRDQRQHDDEKQEQPQLV